MGAEYLQVFIRIADQTQHWRFRTRVPECYSIEDLIPCPMWSERKMLQALEQHLIRIGYEIEEDDLSAYSVWDDTSVMFDFGKRRLVMSGLGKIWNLSQTTIARFAIPLLKSAGWQNWDICGSPAKCMGVHDFDSIPQMTYQKCLQNALDLQKYFAAQNPWTAFEYHENLLISLRQNHQLKHYLIPDEGPWLSQRCLSQGTTLLNILAQAPECGLLSETEVHSSLLIDCDRRLIVQSVEELDALVHALPCDPRDLQLLWPDWHFELNLQGYVGHLNNLGILSDSSQLLLSAERLSAYIQGYYFLRKKTNFIIESQQSLATRPKEKLNLRDWLESILLHPRTKPRLIAHLDQIVSLTEIPIWLQL